MAFAVKTVQYNSQHDVDKFLAVDWLNKGWKVIGFTTYAGAYVVLLTKEQ